jgi:hypothetical protein
VVTADFAPESGFQRGIMEMREDNVTFRLAGFDMTMTKVSGLGVSLARRPCHNSTGVPHAVRVGAQFRIRQRTRFPYKKQHNRRGALISMFLTVSHFGSGYAY